MTANNQPDDLGRELDDTAEFDVIPLFRDDVNGHGGEDLGDDVDPSSGWVVRRDPEP